MAFGFFRRRQKMVVIIMAVLMVTFLVGMQGFQMIFSTTPREEHVFGTVDEAEIKEGDLDSARQDVERLARYVGLGSPMQTPHHEAFGMIRRNGPKMRLAYCLLLHEGTAAGIEVSQGEIDSFLVGVGLVDELYANHIADIREQGMTEKHFRSLIARWLTVYKAYSATAVKTPPSPAETSRLYRDLAEQINLRVLRIDAEELLEDVPRQVADKDIQAQYDSYAAQPAGRLVSTGSFGFGYLVPHRVRVGYLLIDEEPIARAARPQDKVIEDYWVEHEDEFTREVPVDPTGAATRPAARATTKPTSAPATKPAMKTVKKTLAEATEEIIELLRSGQVRQRVESVTNRIENVRAELANEADAGDLATYGKVVKQMILPADGVLKREVTTKFTAEPLDEAIARLAKAARLTGISYPWGEHGKYNLDKAVKVSLDASTGMTLAVALDRITAQAFAAPEPKDKDKTGGEKKKDKDKADETTGPPTLRWAMCRGLDGMLFCHGGDVDMFPIQVGSTDLLDRASLSRHAVLGGAMTSRRGGLPMTALAFMVKEFGVEPRFVAGQVGRDGKRMYVRRGRVIWRVLQADPAHAPVKKGTKVSEFPADLRKLVVKDVRLRLAFELAAKRAWRIEAKARTDGLAEVAKGEKLETSETGLFARKRAIPLQMMIDRSIGQLRIEGVDVPSLPPYMYPWNRVESVNLPLRNITAEFSALRAFERQLPFPGYLNYVLGMYASNMHGRQFMRKAFSLMPADIETRGPGKPPAVTVFLLPARKEVYVLERIDHVPVTAGDLEMASEYVASQLLVNRRWRGMMQWFSSGPIVVRTGFERVEPEKE